MAICIKCRVDMGSPNDKLSHAAVAMATITRSPDGGCLGCGNNLKSKPDDQREEVPQGLTGQTGEVKPKKKKAKPKKE